MIIFSYEIDARKLPSALKVEQVTCLVWSSSLRKNIPSATCHNIILYSDPKAINPPPDGATRNSDDNTSFVDAYQSAYGEFIPIIGIDE